MELTEEGRLAIQESRQIWRPKNKDQVATFAGQVMTLKQPSEKAVEYKLYYLGFESTRYSTINDAKQNATRFAKWVLDQMKLSIMDEPDYIF
ncbi:hypothetical protein ACI2KR_08315 [Pseudomonas luteola]